MAMKEIFDLNITSKIESIIFVSPRETTNNISVINKDSTTSFELRMKRTAFINNLQLIDTILNTTRGIR